MKWINTLLALVLEGTLVLFLGTSCDAPPEKPSIPLKDQLVFEGELLYTEDPLDSVKKEFLDSTVASTEAPLVKTEDPLPQTHDKHKASMQQSPDSAPEIEEEVLSEADTGSPTPVPYRKMTFATLANFDYEYTGGASDRIYEVPEAIKKLHQTDIVLEGYMLPTSYEENFTKKFLLLNFQMNCCFGQIPKLNEIIVVTMKADKTAPLLPTYVRCKVYGRLDVERKAETPEEMTSLYRMEAIKAVEILPPILKMGDKEF